MKIYLVDYNIDEREPKKIFVSQYSSYKIGINVNGVDNSKIKFSKKSDGKPIAVEEEFKGYNTYSFEASTPEKTSYNIWVPYSNTGITFTLEVITTDSTVAELSSGGGMPTDLDLNSLKVSGTLSVDGSNVYLKGGNKLDIGTEKNDIITATNQTVDIACTNLTANGDIECNGTFRGNSIQSYNSITSQSLTCDYVNGYKALVTPGFTAGEDGSGGTSTTITPDNLYIMGSNMIMQGGAGDFQIIGITELTFNLNKDGNILKAVPKNITLSGGNTITVLALEPMS